MGPTIAGFIFMTYGPNTPLFVGSALMLPVFIIVMHIRRSHAAAEAQTSS